MSSLFPNQILYYLDKNSGKVGSIRVRSVKGNLFTFEFGGKLHKLDSSAIGTRLFLKPADVFPKQHKYTGPAFCNPPPSIYDAIVNPPLDDRQYRRMMDKPDEDDWERRALERGATPWEDWED